MNIEGKFMYYVSFHNRYLMKNKIIHYSFFKSDKRKVVHGDENKRFNFFTILKHDSTCSIRGALS